MRHTVKLIMVGGALVTVTLLNRAINYDASGPAAAHKTAVTPVAKAAEPVHEIVPTHVQTSTTDPAARGGEPVHEIVPVQAHAAATVRKEPGQKAEGVISATGCPRPADAKEVKVIAFDPGTLKARLAVNLGSDRFKLVTIKVWDRPEDPRPLIPVIEAARITHGRLQFYTPDLNRDPASDHEAFILMTEMGGGYVCWATPSSLMNEGSYPVATEAKPEITPAAAIPAPRVPTRTRGQVSGLSRDTMPRQP